MQTLARYFIALLFALLFQLTPSTFLAKVNSPATSPGMEPGRTLNLLPPVSGTPLCAELPVADPLPGVIKSCS